jgi:hypothetical protein
MPVLKNLISKGRMNVGQSVIARDQFPYWI